MAKHYSKVKNTLVVLGLIGTIFIGSLGLTGCTPRELETAQANMDTTMTAVLNSEDIQAIENELFSSYTFLGADINKADEAQYSIDINGIAKSSSTDDKSYTTFNYLVSDSYFAEKDATKNEAAIINTLTEIIKNENYQEYSIANVKSLDALNNAMGKATESPLDYFRYFNNFLYGVSDVSLSEADCVASFSTKELTKFSRTKTETTIGIIGYVDGKAQYGPVVRSVTEYESFYIDNIVYIKLTPEEMARAQTDEAFVFEKFVEYVESKQTDKYVIQQTNIADQKQFDANMHDYVSFKNLDK